MIKRLYVNNYRCLENFVLDFEGLSSALLIGGNGSGKSTVSHSLRVFQQLCRGVHRVKDLVTKEDFAQHRTHIPIRFELDVELDGTDFSYQISFEWPETFKEARVLEEKLLIDGAPVFDRKHGQVTLSWGPVFGMDWHLPAFPIINARDFDEQIDRIRKYMATMVLISPIPDRMTGYAESESFQLSRDASNFASCFSALLSRFPASYSQIDGYLKSIIPDVSQFENVPWGESGKQLFVRFKNHDEDEQVKIKFSALSDGEKYFFLSSLLIASSEHMGPFFCLWDEPDSHLSLSEIQHFMMSLRKNVGWKGQFVATSHHPETIRAFSDENTFVLSRKSHLEPTVIRKLEEHDYKGDLIQALTLGELAT